MRPNVKNQKSARGVRESAYFISPDSTAKQRPETFHGSSRVLTPKASTTYGHIIRHILHTHFSKYLPVPSGDVSTATAKQKKNIYYTRIFIPTTEPFFHMLIRERLDVLQLTFKS
jgi:hypothetical protein